LGPTFKGVAPAIMGTRIDPPNMVAAGWLLDAEAKRVFAVGVATPGLMETVSEPPGPPRLAGGAATVAGLMGTLREPPLAAVLGLGTRPLGVTALAGLIGTIPAGMLGTVAEPPKLALLGVDWPTTGLCKATGSLKLALGVATSPDIGIDKEVPVAVICPCNDLSSAAADSISVHA